MNIIKKIILIFLTIIIFLPIVSLIVAINIFKKVKIYRIPEITGGLILLYPYIVKKKSGFFWQSDSYFLY